MSLISLNQSSNDRAKHTKGHEAFQLTFSMIFVKVNSALPTHYGRLIKHAWLLLLSGTAVIMPDLQHTDIYRKYQHADARGSDTGKYKA